MSKGGRERERLRQERIEAEQRESRGGNRRLLVYGGAAVALVAIVALVVVLAGGGSGSENGGSGSGPVAGTKDEGGAHLNANPEMGSTNGVEPDERAGIVPPPVKVINLRTAAKEAGCKLQLGLKDEGHQHIPPGSPEPGYETNPPTSGPHVAPPYEQADGAYSEMPEPIDFVHTLEHGRVEFQYSPKLPEEAQLEMKGMYDTMYAAALLFPNEKMPYQVAATAWTNLIGCPEYKGAITLDALRDFGKATWGKYGGEPVGAFTFSGPTPKEPEEPEEAK